MGNCGLKKEKMIKGKILNKAISDFKKLENRTDFFRIATNLKNNGFETEGQLLILTTWNFALFRYVTKEFDVNELKKIMKRLEPHFEKLNDQNFRTIDFDKYAKNIKAIYNGLAKIEGIKYTGAPKLMHHKNPSLFVMWDGYIRGEKPKKRYKDLEVIKKGYLNHKKYSKDFEGYFQFLKDMQKKFRDSDFKENRKTLAKAIDEFNYVNITLPIQNIEKEIKKSKKKQK